MPCPALPSHEQPVYGSAQPRRAGTAAGVLAILFFWTGTIGCALGYVSIAQARRAGDSASLGIIGFALSFAVFLGIFFYVLLGVIDVWGAL